VIVVLRCVIHSVFTVCVINSCLRLHLLVFTGIGLSMHTVASRYAGVAVGRAY